MAKVRARPETGTLYLDFFFQGKRCREQTSLPDNMGNRKKLRRILERIEAEITQQFARVEAQIQRTIAHLPAALTDDDARPA